MKVVTFGEMMGRMCMPGALKFRQGLPGSMEMMFSGAEANVAVSIAMLGGDARFVTALPNNELSDCAISVLKGLEVDARFVKKTQKGRFGLYFVEPGANQRPSKVIYDREFSSISLTPGSEYPWDDIFDGATWFHISGITPALSAISAEASLIALKKAKEKGITTSCDLNYRKKLWNFDSSLSPKELCRKTMATLLPYVDIIVANEEDADDVMGIKAGTTDVTSGKLEIEKYPEVAKKILAQYPNVKKVAITLRESLSASHNNWGAMLFDRTTDEAVFAPTRNGKYQPYEIKNMVDRIGGGDSFSAALIFAMQDSTTMQCNQKTIEFATASSCLCHSVYGDFNYTTKAEVEALANGDASGRVSR